MYIVEIVVVGALTKSNFRLHKPDFRLHKPNFRLHKPNVGLPKLLHDTCMMKSL